MNPLLWIGLTVMDSWSQQNWYAVHTKPTREDSAAMNIRRMGLEVLLPKTERERKVYGVPHKVIRPLFPGYLFARFTPATYLHLINYARGVSRVVSGCGKPIAVEERIIEAIQSRVGAGGYVRMECSSQGLKPGDRIEVTEGPFRGLKGIFARELSDTARVMILLDMIEYQAQVSVEKRHIDAVAEAV